MPALVTGRGRGERLLDALDARSGIVCVVGAGGKKTLIRRLAEAHTGRVGVTSTTKMAPLPADFGGHRLAVADARATEAVAEATRAHRVVVFTGPPSGPDRLGGIAPDLIAAIHDRCRFDATFVKADGARMRLVKAPGPGEPVLVPGATTILLVVSVQCVGRPLDDTTAHRPERFAALTGADPGAPIEPAHVARLIVAVAVELGAHAPATVIPVINMVDDARLAAIARSIARLALDGGVMAGRVALTALNAPDPLVDLMRA